MAISTEDVRHVARLARISMSDEHVERLAGELADILGHFEKLTELELEDVPPTSHALDVTNVWGADEPDASLPRDEALRNAPDHTDEGFRVPRMRS